MGRKKTYASNADKHRAYRQRLKLRLEKRDVKTSKTILSLFDFSGSWSQPYLDAGYDVIRIDIKTGQDVRLLTKNDLPLSVRGVLSAPPCTDFAVSGARWWADKGNDSLLDALSMVDATMRVIMLVQPAWWVIENPVGRLKDYLGSPKMYFQPCDYGDPYTKKTGLWGNFNNRLPWNKVEPVLGSVMWQAYGGKSEKTKAARSVTPQGFARAFFLANP